MPDFLKSSLFSSTPAVPSEIFVRLVAALVLGYAVAWIYRQTRKSAEIATSFPTTLVLLAVLIAMVTQVIGDNVARAFSLVGALSIVRFRTIVRDTQDTAYVIFAVAVGMAVGAHNLWVAVGGLAVIGLAAFAMRHRLGNAAPDSQPAYRLVLRLGLGHDLEQLLGPTMNVHVLERELLSIETARQGISLDVIYQARLRPEGSPEVLVKTLNRLEGVQSVHLQRAGFDAD
jgi:uncharacterized membrane protein YhiD involved in acid resistance